MKYIISGTDRPHSRTLEVAKLVQGLYQDLGEEVEIIDLREVGLEEINGEQYGDKVPAKMAAVIAKLTAADGLIVICPEYNGSYPGALKHFIDHWKYPDTFEYRPIALIGLGGRFGGLRPVEHLQGVFGYRNGFIFPERVFLSDVWSILKNGAIQDPRILGLLQSQARGFQRFVRALADAGLDANAAIKRRATAPTP